MKNERFLVGFALAALAAACSSSSSNNGGDAGGDSSSTGSTSSSSGGTGFPIGDGGGFGMSMINCYSAADCTDAGPGQLCCYSTMTMTAACQAGPCPMYTQCASSDSECPAGLQCIQSPLGMNVHYCGMGDGGGASSDGGSGHADSGGQTDGATQSDGATEGGSGQGDGAADAGAG
jgi:hypothetical protein